MPACTRRVPGVSPGRAERDLDDQPPSPGRSIHRDVGSSVGDGRAEVLPGWTENVPGGPPGSTGARFFQPTFWSRALNSPGCRRQRRQRPGRAPALWARGRAGARARAAGLRSYTALRAGADVESDHLPIATTIGDFS